MSSFGFFFLSLFIIQRSAMSIIKKRDNGDSTIYLTLTSTSTMNSRTSQETGNGGYMTWVQQTNVQTIVTSSPVTTVIRGTTSLTTTSASNSPTVSTVYVSPSSSSSAAQSSLLPTTSSLDTTEATTALASARRIGSTTDIPTLSTFNDISSSNSSNRSTQIGLAVGIPIAIFSIFFIVLGVWYFLRSRKNKTKNKEFSLNDSYYKSRNSDETITPEKPYPVVFSPGVYLNQDKPQQLQYQVPERKSGFSKRLSKIFPVRNTEQEQEQEQAQTREQEQPNQPTFMKRMSMMTPVFLKKFNLGKIDEDKEATIKPQVLTIDADHKNHIPKVKNKLNLPNPITIGESGLDPVRGGISPSQSLYTVIRSYSKNLGDELDIEVGDKVVILEKHSDGWCKVRLVRMGKEYFARQNSEEIGLVPRMCLQKI